MEFYVPYGIFLELYVHQGIFRTFGGVLLVKISEFVIQYVLIKTGRQHYFFDLGTVNFSIY